VLGRDGERWEACAWLVRVQHVTVKPSNAAGADNTGRPGGTIMQATAGERAENRHRTVHFRTQEARKKRSRRQLDGYGSMPHSVAAGTFSRGPGPFHRCASKATVVLWDRCVRGGRFRGSLCGARGCLLSLVRRTTHTRRTDETRCNSSPPSITRKVVTPVSLALVGSYLQHRRGPAFDRNRQ
jgi:hypothetical protein